MDILTPVKLYENSGNPDPDNDGLSNASIVYHPPTDQFVVLFTTPTGGPALHYDELRAAVLLPDDTLGSVTTLTGTAANIDLDLSNYTVYDPRSEKILIIGKGITSNRVRYNIVSVSGTTCSITQHDVTTADGRLGHPAVLDDGYVVLAHHDHGGLDPQFTLLRANSSTGVLSYIELLVKAQGITNAGALMITSLGDKFVCVTETGVSLSEDMAAIVGWVAGGSLQIGVPHIIKTPSNRPNDMSIAPMDNDRVAAIFRNYTALNWDFYSMLVLSVGLTSVSVDADLLFEPEGGIIEYTQTSRIVHDSASSQLVLLTLNEGDNAVVRVFSESLTLLDETVVLETEGDATIGSDFSGWQIVIDLDNDRYIGVTPYEMDDPADVFHLYMFGLGDVKPLFWTNFLGQSETK